MANAKRLSSTLLVLLVPLAVACAHKKDEQASDKVRQQAAFDLQCDASALNVQKISDDHQMMGVKNSTWGVSGCGRQATYKSSCGLGNCSVINEAQATAAR